MPPLDLETIVLKSGGHESIDQGMCVMEAVSYVAGEEWSDRPKCACPVISSFLRSWNDGLRSDEDRKRLLAPFIPRLVGSKSTTAVEIRRGELALDWLVRVQAPLSLELVPELVEYAQQLRDLPEVTASTVGDAVPILEAARSAARSAAESAARSAARSAAESAAWSAARSAAWSAARSAAESAAWSAARSAAWSAARSAARSAAESALEPLVKASQESAVELVNRMIETKE